VVVALARILALAADARKLSAYITEHVPPSIVEELGKQMTAVLVQIGALERIPDEDATTKAPPGELAEFSDESPPAAQTELHDSTG
jgi:hypothetical protein